MPVDAMSAYGLIQNADPGVGSVLGQVVDSGSAAVQNATVTINRGLFTTTTDGNGNYNFGGTVIVGDWELTVTKVPLNPVTKMITVSKGAATTANVEVN